MARTKNANLTTEIKKGHIERAEEAATIQSRPILMELWSIFYKQVPRDERETYEDFFNRMQGLTSEIVADPASVELDAFSKLHASKIAAPPRTAMNLVASENVEMGRSPYEDEPKVSSNDSKLATAIPSIESRRKSTS